MINSWDKVSINLFKKMQNVPQDEDYVFNIISLCTGKSLNEILEQNIIITSAESKQLAFIEEAPKTHMPKLKYKIGNTTYRLQLSMDDLTTAQYIDYQCMDNKQDKIAETLACVLIPEGHKYNTGYSKDDVVKEIGDNMSIEDALTVCNFFIAWSAILQKLMARNLKRMLRKAIRKAPTKEIQTTLEGAYNELSSLGWEQLMRCQNLLESAGTESTSIQ